MWTTADFLKIAEVQPKENFKADVEFYKLVKHLSLLSGENKDLHQLSKQHPEEPQDFLSRTHPESLQSFCGKCPGWDLDKTRLVKCD